MSNANEPAYPAYLEYVHPEHGRGYAATGSLTKRERAAIDLRVPMSGDDDIDAMIRAANRKDFAAMAMQAYVAGGFNSTFTNEELAVLSGKKADALLAELERTKC